MNQLRGSSDAILHKSDILQYDSEWQDSSLASSYHRQLKGSAGDHSIGASDVILFMLFALLWMAIICQLSSTYKSRQRADQVEAERERMATLELNQRICGHRREALLRTFAERQVTMVVASRHLQHNQNISNSQQQVDDITDTESPPSVDKDIEQQQQPDLSQGCAICMEREYAVGEDILVSPNPNCRHIFHKECMLEYLLQKSLKKDQVTRRIAEVVMVESAPCPCCRQDFLWLNKDAKKSSTMRTDSLSTEDNSEEERDTTSSDGDSEDNTASKNTDRMQDAETFVESESDDGNTDLADDDADVALHEEKDEK